MLNADFENYFNILNKLACEKILWKVHYDTCIASCYPVTFLREENLREKTVSRSAVIDIHKLQEKGLDLGNLLCDNRERNI
ncbi:hypothetical protein JK636_00440 [Clostridium sp. YIM B02515]|uniref:Uncharacterized protein n=1 Tax=Clostridium rhizosphaerae TaxID=2803861 RepID=A0ABS1T4G4_9CLOT|nr:hypothetical protein [Clostridium rhizosphaerae]MBL4934218.1 hypothetical protein [Clostridium rhizosphaerae]